MKALELFRLWAPDGAPWSPWAKPVLFAISHPVPSDAEREWRHERDRSPWQPPAPLDSALVLDLPGARALALALSAAAHGWRPVPLFNSYADSGALVDNEPLRAALADGAALLAARALGDTAPPAFVLDARRMVGKPEPKRFDNRWVVFPQDFPSAARLLASGVRRVVLVQDDRRDPRPDLAHVLLRWQQGGLELHTLDLAVGSAPEPLAVAKPHRFRGLGYRVLALFGLHRNSAGGFGSPLPPPYQGGGFGGGFA